MKPINWHWFATPEAFGLGRLWVLVCAVALAMLVEIAIAVSFRLRPPARRCKACASR